MCRRGWTRAWGLATLPDLPTRRRRAVAKCSGFGSDLVEGDRSHWRRIGARVSRSVRRVVRTPSARLTRREPFNPLIFEVSPCISVLAIGSGLPLRLRRSSSFQGVPRVTPQVLRGRAAVPVARKQRGAARDPASRDSQGAQKRQGPQAWMTEPAEVAEPAGRGAPRAVRAVLRGAAVAC